MEIKKVLILGYGYLGLHFKDYLKENYPDMEVIVTNRTKGGLIFDIGVDQTWSQIPEVDACLWTFPATPFDKVTQFIETIGPRLGRIVAVGSTSALKPKFTGSKVDENSQINDLLDRVQGEKFLQSKGANIVRSSGIYGPNRDPRDWLRRGRIEDFERPINLVHVYDLAQFCWKAMITDLQGQSFIACDSKTYRWKELIKLWDMSDEIPKELSSPSSRTQKIVDASQSRKLLEVDLKFPTVIEGTLS